MTEEPATPLISPRLQQRLGERGAVDVLVTFRAAVADSLLRELGLTRGERPDQGVGRLVAADVHALGTRPDVAAVDERPPRAGDDADVSVLRAHPKVDGRLVERFAAEPAEPQSVSVWFEALPSDLAGLGLVTDLDVNPALGVLGPRQVRALAERSDVRRIELNPEPSLY